MTEPSIASLPAGFSVLDDYPDLVAVLVESLSAIEEELAEALRNADELAEATTRHLLDAGGKRLRPLLAVLASMLADPGVANGQVHAPSENIRSAAVALELTHLATLYHDDVMDEADMRRGVPAAHKQWNNSLAILAGDLIFARASMRMSQMSAEVIRVHAQTFESLVMGQMWETVGPRADQDRLDHYLAVIDGKTASLIATTAHIGALLGGCSSEVVAMMRNYGHNVGMAFQLADDIIDLVSPGEKSGKVPGTDLKERVPTLPTLLLRQVAAEGDQSAQQAVALIDGPLDTQEQVNQALEAIATHPVLERAWELTRVWERKALESIENLDDSPIKQALIAFAHYVVERQN
ncbi:MULTISPECIES: polyprenyl synthetase family protein [Auritidibacter]|uniref:polyprenyl synthetase family protein n=1 Tax=Auritidibacter TaxID=1160973 RepID=UPI000D734364|nr:MULTISPECIES: polyprenyl synthetase family protein [Auritidibacter]NIH71362.1 heptaprenyl diphosphate synthase [Auritidibacter ignavus]PXA80996.1 geranylgeranyl pyrophosphate synthase [Auritidibacter sp. NML120636]RMX23469.1 polyprenyl synthetase family protein [Auritidibacter ignavus]